jgi:hypothetical protein
MSHIQNRRKHRHDDAKLLVTWDLRLCGAIGKHQHFRPEDGGSGNRTVATAHRPNKRLLPPWAGAVLGATHFFVLLNS